MQSVDKVTPDSQENGSFSHCFHMVQNLDNILAYERISSSIKGTFPREKCYAEIICIK